MSSVNAKSVQVKGKTNWSEGLQGHVEGFRVARDLAGDKVGVGVIQQKVRILVDSPVGADSGNVLATGDAASVGSGDVDSGALTDRAADHDVLDGRGVGLPKRAGSLQTWCGWKLD